MLAAGLDCLKEGIAQERMLAAKTGHLEAAACSGLKRRAGGVCSPRA